MSTGINIAPSSDITVGTTAVTSGTDTRVFFQAGGVVQQDANFTFDNTLKRLTLKAVGTAGTDIPFVVQNSAGTGLLFQATGDGKHSFNMSPNTNFALSIDQTNQNGGISVYSSGQTIFNVAKIAGPVGYMGVLNNGNYSFFTGNSSYFNHSLVVGGNSLTPGARLDVRAQGALSTDIAFRVRNSADSANIISVTGNNFVGINTDTQSIIGSSTTVGLRVNNGATNLLTLWDSGGLSLGAGASSSGSAGAGNFVTGVAIGANSSSFINSVTVGPSSYSASISTIAIGQSVASGGSSGTRIVAIGSTVNADTSGGGGSDNVLIGNNLLLGRDNSGNVIIGTHLGNRGSSAGSLGVSRNIYIGGFLDQNVNSRQNIIALGFGVSSASKITPDINDSFQLYFSNNERSFFVNKNTNMVLKSLGALVSGTDFEAAATNTITIHNGTAPTTNIATAGQLYAESGALRYRDSTGTITNVGGSVQAVASAATVTPVYTNKFVKITAQAAALTLANPTGTWAEGQDLMIRIKDDGTARAITWDTNYRAIGVTLPTTTVINKTTYVGIIYNSTDGKWDAIGVTTEA